MSDLLQACKWLLNAVAEGEGDLAPRFSIPENRYCINYGICHNLEEYYHAKLGTGYPEKQVEALFIKWPKFSGDLEYPVPSLSPSMEPSESFIIFPCWEDEGLTLRIELLEFMVQELEREDAS